MNKSNFNKKDFLKCLVEIIESDSKKKKIKSVKNIILSILGIISLLGLVPNPALLSIGTIAGITGVGGDIISKVKDILSTNSWLLFVPEINSKLTEKKIIEEYKLLTH